jgi:hypothetical protein
VGRGKRRKGIVKVNKFKNSPCRDRQRRALGKGQDLIRYRYLKTLSCPFEENLGAIKVVSRDGGNFLVLLMIIRTMANKKRRVTYMYLAIEPHNQENSLSYSFRSVPQNDMIQKNGAGADP